MGGFPNSSEADREFDELRARAYGPHPDIGGDPAALARLRELEAAHRAGVARRPEAPTSERAAGSRIAPPAPGQAGRRRHLAWTIGALALAAGIAGAVFFLSGPRPDATLNATAVQADSRLRQLVVEDVPFVDLDAAPLRAYGAFRGLEIWSGIDRFGSPCLVAVHRPSNTVSEWRCTPASADLIMDVSSTGDGFNGFAGLAGDGIIRFMMRGNSVDAYVYLMPEAG